MIAFRDSIVADRSVSKASYEACATESSSPQIINGRFRLMNISKHVKPTSRIRPVTCVTLAANVVLQRCGGLEYRALLIHPYSEIPR